jgi:legumain
VILFLYDDVANHKQNPFPGQLFNKPTEAGTPGVDVYEGIPGHIDYRGKAVTPQNFLNVLKGNSSGVPEGAKVLQSTEEDTVFIYFADHGAVGLIAFPNDYLLATELIPALEYMHEHKMYSKLVFYLEACESGSMFDKVLNPKLNIYGLTAANEKESSWGTYCQPDDKVDGKTMNSCLGDLFSVSWMENSDEEGPKETLKAQHTFVKAATNLSHVMQYGDLTFLGKATGGQFVAAFMRAQSAPTGKSAARKSKERC